MLIIPALLWPNPANANQVDNFDVPVKCAEKFSDAELLAICDIFAALEADLVRELGSDHENENSNSATTRSPAELAFNDVGNWKNRELFDELRSGGRSSVYWFSSSAGERIAYLSHCKSENPALKQLEMEAFYDSLINKAASQLVMTEIANTIAQIDSFATKEWACEQLKLTGGTFNASSSAVNRHLRGAKERIIYEKWSGSDVVQAARLNLCREQSENDLPAEYIERAVNREPHIGPVSEILDRCNFYLQGNLFQIRKRISEAKR